LPLLLGRRRETGPPSGGAVGDLFASSARALTLRTLAERACNDPHRMQARKTKTKIMEMMPRRVWLSAHHP
jgi:hypothetical protein